MINGQRRVIFGSLSEDDDVGGVVVVVVVVVGFAGIPKNMDQTNMLIRINTVLRRLIFFSCFGDDGNGNIQRSSYLMMSE